jgi:hypothetical protein
MERVGIDEDVSLASIHDPFQNFSLGSVTQSQSERRRASGGKRLVTAFLSRAITP